MLRHFLATAALLFCFAVIQHPALAAESGLMPALSNQDVVDMTKHNLGKDLITQAIQRSAVSFDVSPQALIRLKQEGVDDDIIKAMMNASQQTGSISNDRMARELANATSSRPEVRDAAMAYFSLNRESAIPFLREKLSDQRMDIRGAAALALARLDDFQSAPQIREMIVAPDPEIRKKAALALAELHDDTAVKSARTALMSGTPPLDGHITLLGAVRDSATIPELRIYMTNDPDPAIRRTAARTLGEIGNPTARLDLQKALASDSSATVRREAASALAKLRDPEAVPALISACRVDTDGRRDILAALGEFPEAVPFLVEVIGIPQDKITADELEAARVGLSRLTGRDFGLDADRWRSWLASTSMANAPAQSVKTSTPTFEEMFAAAKEADLAAWTALPDPNDIPTTPPPSQRSIVPTDIPVMPVPPASPFERRDGKTDQDIMAVTPATPAFGMSSPSLPGDIPQMPADFRPEQDMSAFPNTDAIPGAQASAMPPPPPMTSGQAPNFFPDDASSSVPTASPLDWGGGNTADAFTAHPSATETAAPPARAELPTETGEIPGWSAAYEPEPFSRNLAPQGEPAGNIRARPSRQPVESPLISTPVITSSEASTPSSGFDAPPAFPSDIIGPPGGGSAASTPPPPIVPEQGLFEGMGNEEDIFAPDANTHALPPPQSSLGDDLFASPDESLSGESVGQSTTEDSWFPDNGPSEDAMTVVPGPEEGHVVDSDPFPTAVTIGEPGPVISSDGLVTSDISEPYTLSPEGEKIPLSGSSSQQTVTAQPVAAPQPQSEEPWDPTATDGDENLDSFFGGAETTSVIEPEAPAIDPPAGAVAAPPASAAPAAVDFAPVKTSGQFADPSFSDPSTPLPPVREEGMIKADPGKNLPTLGDDFFKK